MTRNIFELDLTCVCGLKINDLHTKIVMTYTFLTFFKANYKIIIFSKNIGKHYKNIFR